jgi:hypothetical protein
MLVRSWAIRARAGLLCAIHSAVLCARSREPWLVRPKFHSRRAQLPAITHPYGYDETIPCGSMP